MSEPSGQVFNIQKFSLHDGPGIRTAVFFKGCPLRCLWCANPESQRGAPQILWNAATCVHCGSCVRTCPEKAIRFENDRLFTDPEKCSGCGQCARGCKENALSVEGRRMRVSEVLEICLQDRDFYVESGGGVTLSGGEALAQPEFASAVLRGLKAESIHTAMETTGFASSDVFERVAPLADLLLYDIKHWSAQKHKEGVGVSNDLILQNMKRAVCEGMRVLPRLPVIPGFNDTSEDAAGFARRLQEIGLDRVQLLPFHQFGESKYANLGRPYAYADVPALHEKDLSEFQQAFVRAGIDAFF